MTVPGEAPLIDKIDNLKELRADEIEMDGARRAYAAGMGATEWAAFLNADEWNELLMLRPEAG